MSQRSLFHSATRTPSDLDKEKVEKLEKTPNEFIELSITSGRVELTRTRLTVTSLMVTSAEVASRFELRKMLLRRGEIPTSSDGRNS